MAAEISSRLTLFPFHQFAVPELIFMATPCAMRNRIGFNFWTQGRWS